MSAELMPGQRTWSMRRDSEGHREYDITHLVKVNNPLDGPYTVMNCPGLPQPGDAWQFDEDADQWAWCQNDLDVSVHPDVKEGSPARFYLVRQRFSTKCPTNGRCNDDQVNDPLLEQPKVSGSFAKDKVEGTQNRFGADIQNSAHESIKGPSNEWDESRPIIKIEQNVSTFEQVAAAIAMRDHVNDAPLWDFDRRQVKLSNVTWDRKTCGSCSYHYVRTLEFEVNFETWDRDVLDEATKVLTGHWDRSGGWVLEAVGIEDDDVTPIYPDPGNPAHFMRAVDRRGNPAKIILDGHGLPFDPEPMPATAGCASCFSSPQQWLVTGFETDQTLTYSALCDWAGPPGATLVIATLTLDDEGFWVLTAATLTVGGLVELGTYELPAGVWECLGPNTMIKVDGSGIGPAAVDLTAVGLTEPGRIHIEKYQEANFLELGIPTTL